MQTIHHHSCPLCTAAGIQPALATKDYTVSGEEFKIYECEACTGRFTQDHPGAADIGKYYRSENYISHSNTNKGLINKLYHQVRKVTLRQKRKLVQKVSGKQTGNLLDIGAGTGLFAEAMRSAGWKVMGLEPDEAARTRARQMNIVLNDITDLFSLPAAGFDAVTLWHVLEHVHDVHGYLRQIGQVLQKDGVLVIAVPNYTSTDAQHYRQHWAAYDVPRHLYHFSPGSMKTLLQKHGFTVRSMHPQWFDSFYVSMLSEKYRTGKPSLVKGVWTGLRSNMNALRTAESCSSIIYVAHNRIS